MDVSFISCTDTDPELYQVNLEETDVKLRLTSAVSNNSDLVLVDSQILVGRPGPFRVSWSFQTNRSANNYTSYLRHFRVLTQQWYTVGHGSTSSVVQCEAGDMFKILLAGVTGVSCIVDPSKTFASCDSLQGIKGERGFTGLPGSSVKGEKGDRGEQGDRGERGAP